MDSLTSPLAITIIVAVAVDLSFAKTSSDSMRIRDPLAKSVEPG